MSDKPTTVIIKTDPRSDFNDSGIALLALGLGVTAVGGVLKLFGWRKRKNLAKTEGETQEQPKENTND